MEEGRERDSRLLCEELKDLRDGMLRKCARGGVFHARIQNTCNWNAEADEAGAMKKFSDWFFSDF